MIDTALHKKNLQKVIDRFDSSFYFYDLDFLENHLKSMNQHKDESIDLWYACKANPLSAIIKVIRNLGIGVDVASQGELEQVLNCGLDGKNLLSTGPSKSKKYLKSLVENQISTIILESHNQILWLQEIAKEKKIKVDVLIRVQIPWETGDSVLGGSEITPFGMDIEEIATFKLEEYTNLNFLGFHVFQWGNILEVEELKKIWTYSTSELIKLAKRIQLDLQVLDLGGGLGIPYQNGGVKPDFKLVNQALMDLKKEFSLKKIWMELGRYSVGECGLYLTQIIDKKIVRGKQILVLDGGINHLARPALTNEGFPCELFRESTEELQNYSVHGPLCTSLDHLGNFDLPSDSKPGDWLIFKNTGAYGFTEAMPFFLCHNLPAEVISYKGDLVFPRNIKRSTEWMV